MHMHCDVARVVSATELYVDPRGATDGSMRRLPSMNCRTTSSVTFAFRYRDAAPSARLLTVTSVGPHLLEVFDESL